MRTGTPSTAVFVDCETRPTIETAGKARQSHQLWFGWASAGRIEGGRLTRRKECRFETAAEFWAWLGTVRHARERTYLFAHNLGFDLTILGFWGLLDRGEWSLSRTRTGGGKLFRGRSNEAETPSKTAGLLIVQDPPTVVTAWHRSGWGVQACDTLNYFDMPLAKLGDLVDLVKLEFPAADDPPEVWDAYCKRDVEIMESAVSRLVHWWKTEELGPWPLTLPAGSLTAWKSRWMTIQSDIPQDARLRDMERRACFSGRVEAFWVGNSAGTVAESATDPRYQADLFRPPPKAPFFHLDATSFYGMLLSQTDVPVRTRAVWWEDSGGEMEAPDLGPDCIASVRIRHDSERWPLRIGDRVIWPTGRYDTTLTGPELVRAVRAGAIDHVYSVAQYDLGPLFQDFAHGMWEAAECARQQGNGLLNKIAKRMLSVLAGKMGQHGTKWTDRPNMIPRRPWDRWTEASVTAGTVRQFRAISHHVQELLPAEDPEHVWPALLAFITAAGRETLLTWMRSAGPAHCLYCATDAVIVTRAGLDNLDRAGFLCDGALGFLRIIGESDHLEIMGPGAYRFGDRIVHAGRPLQGQIVAPGVIERTKFQRLHGTISMGGGDRIEVSSVRQLVPRRSPVGTRGPGGWVIPLTVDCPDPAAWQVPDVRADFPGSPPADRLPPVVP